MEWILAASLLFTAKNEANKLVLYSDFVCYTVTAFHH